MSIKQTLIVPAALLALAGLTASQQTVCGDDAAAVVVGETVQAKVRTVDLEKHTFTAVLEQRELSLTYSDRTSFVLDGEKSTAKEVLTVGREVRIAYEGKLATEVSAKTGS